MSECCSDAGSSSPGAGLPLVARHVRRRKKRTLHSLAQVAAPPQRWMMSYPPLPVPDPPRNHILPGGFNVLELGGTKSGRMLPGWASQCENIFGFV